MYDEKSLFFFVYANLSIAFNWWHMYPIYGSITFFFFSLKNRKWADNSMDEYLKPSHLPRAFFFFLSQFIHNIFQMI